MQRTKDQTTLKQTLHTKEKEVRTKRALGVWGKVGGSTRKEVRFSLGVE